MLKFSEIGQSKVQVHIETNKRNDNKSIAGEVSDKGILCLISCSTSMLKEFEKSCERILPQRELNQRRIYE